MIRDAVTCTELLEVAFNLIKEVVGVAATGGVSGKGDEKERRDVWWG